MNFPQLEEDVRSHYESLSLDPATLAGLRSQSALRRPARGVWIAGLSGAAAAVLLTLSAVALLQNRTNVQLPGISASIQPMSTGNRPTASADLLAIRLHADWCPVSKQMMPLCSQLEEQYGAERVLFVDLNLTTDQSRRQAELLAASLHLRDQWTREQWKSGELILIRPDNSQLIARFGPDQPLQQMMAMIQQALSNPAG